MATKLQSYKWGQQSRMTEGEKATYDWDTWFDGSIWRLRQGQDFEPHPLMMERIIRTRATGRGVKVRLRHEGANGDAFGRIVLQRTQPPVEAKPEPVKDAPVKAAAPVKATKAAPVKATKVTTKATKAKPQPNGQKAEAAPTKTPAKVSKTPARKAPAKRTAKQPATA